ncbi:hypothetical protein V8E55_004014 [Tylopilus felleus]
MSFPESQPAGSSADYANPALELYTQLEPVGTSSSFPPNNTLYLQSQLIGSSSRFSDANDTSYSQSQFIGSSFSDANDIFYPQSYPNPADQPPDLHHFDIQAPGPLLPENQAVLDSQPPASNYQVAVVPPPPPTLPMTLPPNLAPSPLTSLTKQQRLSLFSAVKKNIDRLMFANDAVPRTRVERNNMIKAAINTASEDVLGYHPPPVKLQAHCIDVMWEICMAFRQYAEDTVDLFFALQLTLQDDGDEIAHRPDKI